MKATVVKIIEENHRVRTIVVRPEKPISFKTGQAMRINIPGVKIGRLYSVAVPGGEAVTELKFTIAIASNGRFTPHVLTLKENDEIEVLGPYGSFTFDENDTRDVALVAGGTGISVLHAILLAILNKKNAIKIHLIFSILTEQDMIYKDDLERLAKEHENFTHSLVVTNKSEGWKGRCGFVEKAMLDEDYKDYHQRFYICGPGPFIDCVEKILTDANVPKDRIFIDRWGAYKPSLLK